MRKWRWMSLGYVMITADVSLNLIGLLAERGIRTLRQAREASRKTWQAGIRFLGEEATRHRQDFAVGEVHPDRPAQPGDVPVDRRSPSQRPTARNSVPRAVAVSGGRSSGGA